MRKKDVFICHASKDKKRYVYPLKKILDNYGISYWIDEAEIHWGDSILTKISEGLTKSRFVIVLITENFLNRNWTERELNSALSQEIDSGKTIVLPLLVFSPEDVFQKYPFLKDKRALLWKQGANFIVNELLVILETDKSNYLKWLSRIEEIEVNESLTIGEIQYGEGTQIEYITENKLLSLQKDLKIPQEFVSSDGRRKCILNLLFDKSQLKALKENENAHFPSNVIIKGKTSVQDSTVAVYFCTDTFYLNDYDKPINGYFELACKFGRGGISAFVDNYGNYQIENRFLAGDGFGAIGLLVVVEFKNNLPICRSPFVIGIRRGIRYPDDIWLSKETNKPLTFETEDINNSRFIFMSRQPNGSSTDIFVADFDGTNMCNLTKKNETSYDGFYDEKGNEVARWVNKEIIRYCSVKNGKREIRETIDCFRK
jgi:hypothetical protein